MFQDRHKGIDIELNLYQRAGKWTGEYILTKRSKSQTLNEVNSMSESGETKEQARELALCEARRSIDRFVITAPLLFKRVAQTGPTS
jgi:hypothetical protein